MIDKPIIIVDEIGAIVASLPAFVPVYLPDGTLQGKDKKTLLQILQSSHPEIQDIFYQYGYSREIVETLKQKDESQTQVDKKYPLVILFFDFEEDSRPDLGYYATSPLRIAIVYQTGPALKAAERYESIFKPVLYPIYQAFINQLQESGRLMWDKGYVEHRKKDKPYYDAGTGVNANAGDDFLDAIEIKDLKLKFYLQNC